MEMFPNVVDARGFRAKQVKPRSMRILCVYSEYAARGRLGGQSEGM